MPESWTPEYSVGHDDLDSQHQHILALIASFVQAGRGHGKKTADVLFEHICRYLKWHFSTEEAVMLAGGYPMLLQHRDQHQRCMTTLATYAAEMKSSGSLNVEEVAIFLTKWLETHLLESDRKYMLYVLRPPAAE